MPVISAPTSTLVTGCRMPVAETVLTTAPRVTAAVLRSGGASLRRA
jgi:hypothetical protein